MHNGLSRYAYKAMIQSVAAGVLLMLYMMRVGFSVLKPFLVYAHIERPSMLSPLRRHRLLQSVWGSTGFSSLGSGFELFANFFIPRSSRNSCLCCFLVGIRTDHQTSLKKWVFMARRRIRVHPWIQSIERTYHPRSRDTEDGRALSSRTPSTCPEM